MARLYFSGLGCAKNQVDGEVLLGKAREAGHEIVTDPKEADVVVVNTCAFIEEARQESIDTILALAETARERGRLVVSGCLAQRYGEELLRHLPEVDVVLGTGEVERIGEALAAPHGTVLRGGQHTLPAADTARMIDAGARWAYVKISDGCDHECSFCAIPSFRGRHRSRPVEDVVAEAERLASAGIVELNLVGQDLSAYGSDRGAAELAVLLERLGQVAGIERVRCLYLYPNTLSEEILEAMASVAAVCPYVDLPLQHADAGVLAAMRRGGDAASLMRLLERVRTRLPEATVRSTFIVGFPGEDEAAFECLCRFVEQARFDRIAVFRYSAEDGTAAAGLPGRVPRAVAERRRDQLLALQEEFSRERLARHVGSRQRILVEGEGDGGWFGRTVHQAPEIDGVTFLGETAGGLRRGDLVEAEITASDAFDLFAQPPAGD
ncbi:MAG: 30S ribosomal protein S12 methylthiotransferase RimO [Deltaproteobacteria bacterium]|nr:MAG: 30S ribosomal protein S12 methylthiotransferase RimO [Deltaproteobacteria bacterium]